MLSYRFPEGLAVVQSETRCCPARKTPGVLVEPEEQERLARCFAFSSHHSIRRQGVQLDFDRASMSLVIDRALEGCLHSDVHAEVSPRHPSL